VSLEYDFWDCIEQIAILRGTTLDRLVAQEVGDAGMEGLFAVLRVFVSRITGKISEFRCSTFGTPPASRKGRCIGCPKCGNTIRDEANQELR
jgi:predicted DNA-binding ribbon-helix-helix protein